jgi:serine protease Do
MRSLRILAATIPLVGVWLLAGPAPALATGLPEFVPLVETNGPAVVNISTRQTNGPARRAHGFNIPDLPEGSPLNEFFRRYFGDEGGDGGDGGDDNGAPGDGDLARSLGSGFIVSADGYVLTNHHVVDGADEVIVRTNDRREFVATVVGSDKRSDTALLKVDATGLPTVKLGSSKDLKVGEWVLAIGSPFGFDHSASAGIISALGRSLPSENYVPFIQTDVAINPGNSGGPLFNLAGEVVGVNSQIYSRTGGFMGLSFAIPIDVAMDAVEQLKAKGRVTRGWLGVLIQDVTRDLAETFGMKQPAGALVAQVLPDSPAEKAGLEPGDVILRYNGAEVTSSGTLPQLVGATRVGQSAQVQVLRKGQPRDLTLVIGELPEEDAIAKKAGQREPAMANRLGLVLRDLSPEVREQVGVPKGGVLVEEVKPGPAQQVGIRAGDVILMLDNQPVSDIRHFKGMVEALVPGRSVAVLVQRGGGRMFYALRIPKS